MHQLHSDIADWGNSNIDLLKMDEEKLSQDFKVAPTNEARKTYSTLKDHEVIAHLEPSGTCFDMPKGISGIKCSCPPHPLRLNFFLLESHPTFK